MTEPTVSQLAKEFVDEFCGGSEALQDVLDARIRGLVAEAAIRLAAADAAYIAVSTLIKNHDSEYALDEDDAGNVAEKAVHALQSSDAAAALARRDAETRLDEHNKPPCDCYWENGEWEKFIPCERKRELTRQLDEAKAPKEAR